MAVPRRGLVPCSRSRPISARHCRSAWWRYVASGGATWLAAAGSGRRGCRAKLRGALGMKCTLQMKRSAAFRPPVHHPPSEPSAETDLQIGLLRWATSRARHMSRGTATPDSGQGPTTGVCVLKPHVPPSKRARLRMQARIRREVCAQVRAFGVHRDVGLQSEAPRPEEETPKPAFGKHGEWATVIVLWFNLYYFKNADRPRKHRGPGVCGTKTHTHKKRPRGSGVVARGEELGGWRVWRDPRRTSIHRTASSSTTSWIESAPRRARTRALHSSTFCFLDAGSSLRCLIPLDSGYTRAPFGFPVV